MAGVPKKYEKACVNLIIALSVVLGCIFVVPKIMLLFMPFIIGGVLAALANPLVRFFEKRFRIRRKAGSALVIVSVIGGICFLIYFLANYLIGKMLALLQVLPEMWSDMEVEFIGFTRKWSGMIDNLPEEVVAKMTELGQSMEEETGVLIGKLSMSSADAVGKLATNIPGLVIAVVMCLLSAYFFVAEKDYVTTFMRSIVPVQWKERSLLLKQITIDVIAGYLKAQLKIGIWVYLVIMVGLLLLKVQYGYFVAIPIAFLDMMPILGTGTVLLPWAIFKILSGDYAYALGLMIVWGVSQLVRQIIQPKVIGDSMGVAAIPSLILLYVGYKLAGVTGMIVAVPLGNLILAMNDVGFFDNSKHSIYILWHGFNEFRQFTNEDLKEIKKDETKL